MPQDSLRQRPLVGRGRFPSSCSSLSRSDAALFERNHGAKKTKIKWQTMDRASSGETIVAAGSSVCERWWWGKKRSSVFIAGR